MVGVRYQYLGVAKYMSIQNVKTNKMCDKLFISKISFWF